MSRLKCVRGKDHSNTGKALSFCWVNCLCRTLSWSNQLSCSSALPVHININALTSPGRVSAHEVQTCRCPWLLCWKGGRSQGRVARILVRWRLESGRFLCRHGSDGFSRRVFSHRLVLKVPFLVNKHLYFSDILKFWGFIIRNHRKILISI